MIAAQPRQNTDMTDDDLEIEKALAAAGIDMPASAITAMRRLPSLTNRTWRIVAGDDDLVVRLPGPGTEHHIDRRAEAHNIRIAAASGIGSPIPVP